METCIAPLCSNAVVYKKIGICSTHYQQLYNLGYRKLATAYTRTELLNLLALTQTPHPKRKAIDI